jgi:hypothetical protein
MHKNIVNQKICYPIQGDANAGKKPPIKCFRPQNNQPRRGNGKHETKQIVEFEGTFSRLVVTFMPEPHESMHDIFVGKPRNEFHEKEKQKCNEYLCHFVDVFYLNTPTQ